MGSNMATGTNLLNHGKVASVRGSVVDVRFDRDLPPIHSVLHAGENARIVIEVLSASNTVTEMLEKEQLCLANGCQEFWVVDPDLRIVKVMTPDGRGITYHSGQEIPLSLLNNARISVDAVFAPTIEPKNKLSS